MAPGQKLVTARDVARLAGVSQATVSYILSGRAGGDAHIRDETRQRVLDAVDALNYVPNHTARSLRRRRTERVCVVLPILGVPTCDLLMQHLQGAAATHGYSIIIMVGGSPEREAHAIDQLRRGLADGAVFVDPGYLSDDALLQLVRANLAVVVLSNSIAVPGVDVVRTNSEAASYEAVTYLLDRGHRRIAFLGHCGSSASRAERAAGYQRALHARGIAPDPHVALGSSNSREAAYANAQRLLRLDDPPSAIFAASDIAAISAIWAIRDGGLRIPDEVAVVGFGNIPEGETTFPPLTTVGPHQAAFDDVAQLLFSRLCGEAPGDGRTLHQSWRLVLRGSA